MHKERRNPSMERRVEAQTILSLALTKIEVDEATAVRARNLIGLGFGPFDALHLATEESGGADVLLTTDDRLLKRTAQSIRFWSPCASIARNSRPWLFVSTLVSNSPEGS